MRWLENKPIQKISQKEVEAKYRKDKLQERKANYDRDLK